MIKAAAHWNDINFFPSTSDIACLVTTLFFLHVFNMYFFFAIVCRLIARVMIEVNTYAVFG